jgi:hypothetical protein
VWPEPEPEPGPEPGPGMRSAAEAIDAHDAFEHPIKVADRSLQLPVLLFCWALGGESNNVTFLIRLYVRDTARSRACLAFKQSSDAAGESINRALHAHAHARLEHALFRICTPLLRACGQTNNWGRWSMLGAGCHTAAILLPGVVGASPVDWYTLTVSMFFHSSSRHPGL